MNARAKEKALTEFDREFDSLRTLLRTLQPEALEKPVYTGEGVGWRVRDLIPHLAVWQSRAAKAARKVAVSGVKPGPEERVRAILGISETADELNQATFDEWKGRNLREQLTEMGKIHQDMMEALNGLRPELLMNGEAVGDVFLCFRVPGLEHVRMHRKDIEAAVAKEGETKDMSR
ncbi:MAG: maleylpyruvate isomerase N-terminal domain-containing protein [Chloroflexota bacterium]|nr:maleylpyruvate isomerase N-terminal domain-containing protein [Chloroflexota bacterium]